ncbi:MAG: FkbM family methyltransferase [Gammaproteobacteria bacterium]|nr:FkbM family methyltransferase [Gammaproteobacteria bacterium]
MIIKRIPGTFVEASIRGQTIRFFVHNNQDLIQRHHIEGEFYEPEELWIMSRYVTSGSRYLDVGANVGNHVVYLAKCIGLKDIVVVEPNGPAIALLQLNLLLNGLESVVDQSFLGCGLSDCESRADMENTVNNLGGAKFVEDGGGPFTLQAGDVLFGDRDFDFIKIDTEGMELKCLLGMERLIRRCRPTLFVEVDEANVEPFLGWCSVHDYVVRERFRRYTVNENYLVAPA